jgi:hypothetical protein
MTPALAPMASFAELLSTALRATTQHLAEGSRRNAQEALEARYDLARQGYEIMAALPPAETPVTIRRSRRPA